MGGLLGTLKRHLLQGLGLHPETPRPRESMGQWAGGWTKMRDFTQTAGVCWLAALIGTEARVPEPPR